MPPARYAALILAVLAAGALTVWLLTLAGMTAGTPRSALWALPPLAAAALALLIRRRL